MDFIVGLPMALIIHDSILEIEDTLTKSAHLIPMKDTCQELDITRVFVNEIVRLHGILNKIISDRGSIFTGWFWTRFQEALGE